MAGFDPQLITGAGQPTVTSAPTATSTPGRLAAAVSPQAHHGLIGLVLLAVVILLVLDRAGFRFAVTVGRR